MYTSYGFLLVDENLHDRDLFLLLVPLSKMLFNKERALLLQRQKDKYQEEILAIIF